jgi:hypothetical protein
MKIPTRAPILALLGLVMGLLFSTGIVWTWRHFYATPQQLHFLKIYARSSLAFPRVQEYELSRVKRRYPAKEIHAYLDNTVYDHGEVLKWPALACGTVLVLSIGIGAVLDRRRRALLRRGLQVGGRRIVTLKEFNRKARQGWFGLDVEVYANPLDRS